MYIYTCHPPSYSQEWSLHHSSLLELILIGSDLWEVVWWKWCLTYCYVSLLLAIDWSRAVRRERIPNDASGQKWRNCHTECPAKASVALQMRNMRFRQVTQWPVERHFFPSHSLSYCLKRQRMPPLWISLQHPPEAVTPSGRTSSHSPSPFLLTNSPRQKLLSSPLILKC